MATHCCDLMKSQVEFTCPTHSELSECPDALISFSKKFYEYGLYIHDGGTSTITIRYCPWCGAKLPESLRDRWFSELEALGYDEPLDQEIPERYKSDAWYRF